MATDVHSDAEPSVSKLIGGIIEDAQQLMTQQAELLKQDVRKDLRQAHEVGLSLGLSFALLGGAGLLFLFMLAHLLSWIWPALPLWGSFGLVASLLALLGGWAYYHAQEKLDKLNPLPEESVKALEETLQWKTNPN